MVLVNDQAVDTRLTKAPRISRRQRFFARITRNSSSPQLSKLNSGHPPSVRDQYSKNHSVSCISLHLTRPVTPAAERPLGFRVAETLDIPRRQVDNMSVGIPNSVRRKPVLTDMWGCLPGEVQVQILRYLEPRELVRCSAVSRKWHSLCFDGQLWSNLDATGYYNRIPVDQLSKIITGAGPFVRNLNLRGCVQLRNDWRLEVVVNACRNLLTASLEGCKFEQTTIHTIVSRNPRLAQLNIAGLKTANNRTCRLISKSCPLLESLNVSWCSSMDARGIKKIVEECKNLRELRACEVARFNDPGSMQTIFKSNKLEVLHLGACESIDDAAIAIMVEGVDPEVDPFTNKPRAPPRKLVDLDLSRCANLTDQALRSLAGNVPNLEALQLGGCVSLTDSGFTALLPTLGKLTHLDLEECSELTNATLLALARGPAAKKLEHLQCSYCENMGDQGMTEIIRKCPGLRNLEMDNTRVSDLVLGEAAHAVRHRLSPPNSPPVPGSCSPRVALRLVVYDCASITWPGVRDILARNADSTPSTFKPELIQLKCFYGWQQTVDEHMKRVLRGDRDSANRLESKWAEHMMLSEDPTLGRRRRRRQALWDDDEFIGRRRGRSGCVIC
ncbi:unnamed protein product [Tuber aestivum]|uniref:F-box domain-containing protein n=1 Tax=Tuber aestivum TaxID=59557 RepID=A0A292PLY5_9PEZI|nr:unnamed protein product [Tuber aestivum]